MEKVEGCAAIKAILQEAVDSIGLTDDQLAEYKNMIDETSQQLTYVSAQEAAAINYKLHSNYFLKNGIHGVIQNYGNGREFTDMIRTFAENYIDPMVYYIHDQLDGSNSTLYLLEKYKRRTEWFLAGNLLEKYHSANSSYEKVFEDDLRMYLFDQGVDYPFSTPDAPSGRTDIVGLINTKDPLILEIKIFDKDKGYRKNRIISGFSQIVKYTGDYNKHVGYLVVFNVDEVEIEIQQPNPNRHFPCRIEFNGKIFYIIIVNLNFGTSASKLGKLNVEQISTSELFAGISEN
jgi:hypothetical protein